MAKKLWLLGALMALCTLLSACSGFNPVTEELMKPPRLTAEQKEIDDALHDAVIASNISFKYPKTGDYRSSFVFHDIDGDCEEEAIVFYAVNFNDYTRLSIMDRIDGQWRSVCEKAGVDRDVEFIDFARISGRPQDDIIIGWSSAEREEMEMNVYSYEDGELESILDSNRSDTSYNAYLIDDFNADGLSDICMLSRDSGTRAQSSWIKLVTYDGYNVTITSELPLSESILHFAGTTSGQLTLANPQKAIFIDEMIGGGELVTEVFTISDRVLVPVIGYDLEYAQEEGSELTEEEMEQASSLYEQTRRADETAICMDINGDGVIEIPTSSLLPGYEDADKEVDPIYLTEYNQLSGSRFHRVYAGVFNHSNRSGGYRVEFPPEWIGRVTVVNQSENGEWSFIKYDPELDEPLLGIAGELARIRVVSQKDYQDKFLDNYKIFETRGAFTYYGYVPPDSADPELSITLTELQRMFRLL